MGKPQPTPEGAASDSSQAKGVWTELDLSGNFLAARRRQDHPETSPGDGKRFGDCTLSSYKPEVIFIIFEVVIP